MTTTTTSHLAGGMINACMQPMLGYAEGALRDIPAEQFAHMPHPTMSHPAFIIGHLSIYPNKILKLIGREDLVVEKDGWVELFEAGATCDADASTYPSKDELVSVFLERFRTVSTALESVTDETLAAPNPMGGRMSELFPTVGSAANFILNSHTMMHLGQISAWRRAVGLPSVM